MSLAVGSRVGPYEILAAIGAGGMGEVYRARDTKLKRDVALKVLPEHFTADSDRLARFQREAEVLATLNHPHIAQIHGLEESNDVRALVLELVEGPTLAERIAEGPIPLDEALPIARQIAEALEAAHEHGIIHRDLKPANIKVRPDGTVKVLDFGLAKALDDAAAAGGAGTSRGPGAELLQHSPTMTSPAMTLHGVILGTAPYMSPEQAKGRPADKRSDIWAFGCVVFEMLTGKRAFDAEDVSDTLALVLKGEPDWALLPAELSPALRTLIRRSLERDRRRRIADVSTALFVLDEGPSLGPGATGSTRHDPTVVQQQVDTAVAHARRHLIRHRLLPAVGVVLLAALVGGIALWTLRPMSQPPVARFAFPLPDGQGLSGTGRSVIAVSHDGTQLVYVANNNQLFVRSLSSFEPQALDGTDLGLGLATPAFSPDDRSLAFFSPGGSRAIKRVSLSGGAAVTLCPSEAPSGLTWDSSGILVGQGSRGIVRCAPGGGPPEQLVTVQDGEEAHGPQMLPDGTSLLYTVAKTADGAARWDKGLIVLQSLGSSTRKTIIDGGSDARYVATGHLLYALSGIVFAVPFDPVRQEVTGGAAPVIEGVRRSLAGNTGVAQFATSDTGTLVYAPGPTRTSQARALALADRAGVLTRLPLPTGAYERTRASQDGSHLAVGTDDGNEAIVWIFELGATKALRRLTIEGRNRFPVWSPDGRHVAFQSDRGGDLAIFSQRVDGTTPAERLTKPDQGEAHVPESWSSDGRHLSFSVVAKDSRFALWTLSVETKKAAPFGVQSAEPTNSVFSPDGRWIAYNSSPAGGGGQSPNRGVYVQPFPATGSIYQAPRQILDFHPVWTSKGTELIFTASAASRRLAAMTVITRPAFAFGSPTSFPAMVTGDRTSGQMRAYDVLPDGRLVGPVSESDAGVPTPFASELRVVLNWSEELKQKVPRP